jgi:preprotein translocase subunit SecG
MKLVIVLLTGVLVLDCLFLILLILVQLPKKEAGLGQAFGSTTTDALFGAGSGNVLTKLTKYAAGVFFILALILSILSSHANVGRKRTRALEEGLGRRPSAKQLLPPATAPKTAPVSPTNLLQATPSATSNLLLSPASGALLPAPATSAPPAKPN